MQTTDQDVSLSVVIEADYEHLRTGLEKATQSVQDFAVHTGRVTRRAEKTFQALTRQYDPLGKTVRSLKKELVGLVSVQRLQTASWQQYADTTERALIRSRDTRTRAVLLTGEEIRLNEKLLRTYQKGAREAGRFAQARLTLSGKRMGTQEEAGSRTSFCKPCQACTGCSPGPAPACPAFPTQQACWPLSGLPNMAQGSVAGLGGMSFGNILQGAGAALPVFSAVHSGSSWIAQAFSGTPRNSAEKFGRLFGGLGQGVVRALGIGPGPSEGRTREAILGPKGSLLSVGVDNGGSMQAARQMGEQFQKSLRQIIELAGGRFSENTYISRSARSGLRLRQNNYWQGFKNEAALVQYLVANRLTGANPSMQRAARRSDAGTIQEILGDMRSVRQAENFIANEKLSPWERSLKAVRDRFGEMIKKSRELGLETSALIRMRDREIQSLKTQRRQNVQMRVLNEAVSAGSSLRAFMQRYQFSPSSSLGNGERLVLAQSEFERLTKAVRGGAFGAVPALTRSAQTLLSFGREQFASSVDFAVLENNVLSQLRSLQSEILNEKGINNRIAEAIDRADENEEQRNAELIGALREEVGNLREELVQLTINREVA